MVYCRLPERNALYVILLEEHSGQGFWIAGQMTLRSEFKPLQQHCIHFCYLILLQVSFFSTSPELSNKQRFEFFSRTIPSDHYQVKAMVAIVKKMQWSYVSIIYEESNYGIKVRREGNLGLSNFMIDSSLRPRVDG
jgi:hypothetical protein